MVSQSWRWCSIVASVDTWCFMMLWDTTNCWSQSFAASAWIPSMYAFRAVRSVTSLAIAFILLKTIWFSWRDLERSSLNAMRRVAHWGPTRRKMSRWKTCLNNSGTVAPGKEDQRAVDSSCWKTAFTTDSAAASAAAWSIDAAATTPLEKKAS